MPHTWFDPISSTMLGLALALGVAFIAPVAGARAQDTSYEEPADEGRQRALELYEQSAERYDAGDYEVAVALLEEAYDLAPEPILLYNLARAEENLGHLARAIERYEAFLEARPETPNRAAIEARVRNYRDQLARHAAEQAEREEAARLELERAVTDAARPQRTAKVAPWVVAGAGVLVLAVAGALGGLSLEARSQAESDPTFLGTRDASDRAVALAWGADLGFVVGGAALVLGVIWGIVDVRGARADGALVRF